MKTAYGCPQFNRLANAAVCLAVLLLTAPHSRAGLILEMNVIRYDQNAWFFAPNLVTNTTAPNVPFGFYNIMSHDYPTNGAGTLYRYDTNGFNGIAEGPYGFSDFNSMVYELTNGTWSIFVTNSVMTNVYHFTVALNLVSNDLPAVTVTFPPNGATAVTNQPVFTWQGPTNYTDLVVYEANNNASLPVTQTNWPSASVLLQGLNTFTVHYDYYSHHRGNCVGPAGCRLASHCQLDVHHAPSRLHQLDLHGRHCGHLRHRAHPGGPLSF